ncbi:MAG: hypothetical protein R2882_12050 [Gemmatimonadales bacterium]
MPEVVLGVVLLLPFLHHGPHGGKGAVGADDHAPAHPRIAAGIVGVGHRTFRDIHIDAPATEVEGHVGRLARGADQHPVELAAGERVDRLLADPVGLADDLPVGGVNRAGIEGNAERQDVAVEIEP